MPDTLGSLVREIVDNPPMKWQYNHFASEGGFWVCFYCEAVSGRDHAQDCTILCLQRVLEGGPDA